MVRFLTWNDFSRCDFDTFFKATLSAMQQQMADIIAIALHLCNSKEGEFRAASACSEESEFTDRALNRHS